MRAKYCGDLHNEVLNQDTRMSMPSLALQDKRLRTETSFISLANLVVWVYTYSMNCFTSLKYIHLLNNNSSQRLFVPCLLCLRCICMYVVTDTVIGLIYIGGDSFLFMFCQEPMVMLKLLLQFV